MKKLLEIIKQLKTVSGLITSIVIIGGATLFFDSRDDKQTEAQEDRHEQMMDSISSVKQQTEYNSIELSMLGEGVNNLQDSMAEIKKEQEVHHEAIGDLGWAIKNIDNFTPEQMKEILNRELKKNMSLKRDIDYDFPSWWIQPLSRELILTSKQFQ